MGFDSLAEDLANEHGVEEPEVFFLNGAAPKTSKPPVSAATRISAGCTLSTGRFIELPDSVKKGLLDVVAVPELGSCTNGLITLLR